MSGLLRERFARVSSAHRNRVAVYGLSERVSRTFGDLAAEIATLERALSLLGLPSRPTIVSRVGNRCSLIPLFAASLALEAALVLIDSDAPMPEVLRTADAHRADAVIVPAGPEAMPFAPVALPCSLAAIVRAPGDTPPWRLPHEAGGMVLKLTSGSTDAPKAVVAPEERLINDGQHVIEAMEITSADINLAAIPMAHSYGIGNLVMPLFLQGTPLVLRDRFLPAQWTSDIADYGVTVLPGVPFIFDYLRRLGDGAARAAGVRLLVTAGAPIDVETVRHFKDRFGVKIHSLYGTSETGSIAFDDSDDVHDPVSVGHPVRDTAVTLQPMPDLPAAEGRIAVQGSAVCRRYAHADGPPDAARAAFTAHGFLTADIGTQDGDGRLTLVGRVSGFVNVAGRKVHPREVERVIAGMADVAHVSVFGLEQGARGEELVAVVERRRPDLAAAAVRSHCAAVLSPFKVPRRVVFADEIGVDSRGKTLREAVAARLRAVDRTDDL